MNYDRKRTLQIADDRKRVLKISATLPVELHTLRLFEQLAPQYAPKNTHLVTLRGEAALEMDYTGECIGNVLDTLRESEIALCLLQSADMLLLIGNALKIRDFHAGNVCFKHRGPNIQIRFIDTEQWIIQPAVGIRNPVSVIEVNARVVLFSFWDNVVGPSRNNRVHALKCEAITLDESKSILVRLYDLARFMRAFVELDCAERAREIEGRINELFKLYMIA